MTKIVLATTSPYRKEAFKFLAIPFETEGSGVDESLFERNHPKELVKLLSKLKAQAVAKNHKDAIVIGLDSLGYFKNKILEKPKSRKENFHRLKMLSGNSHEFLTGVYMINTVSGKTVAKVVKTRVFMRKLSDKEINRYLDQDESYKTLAAGYAAQDHISASFVKRIEGSPYNLFYGIPLETIVEMLSELGVDLSS